MKQMKAYSVRLPCRTASKVSCRLNFEDLVLRINTARLVSESYCGKEAMDPSVALLRI